VGHLSKKLKREAKNRYKKAAESHNTRRDVSSALLYAIEHPLRREALRVLNAAARPITPKELSELMPWDGEGVSFHIRVLEAKNLAHCTGTRQVRGATEHFYVSKVVGNDLLTAILAGTQGDDRWLFEELGAA